MQGGSRSLAGSKGSLPLPIPLLSDNLVVGVLWSGFFF